MTMTFIDKTEYINDDFRNSALIALGNMPGTRSGADGCSIARQRLLSTSGLPNGQKKSRIISFWKMRYRGNENDTS